jgi:hypothetical protein
VQREYDTTRRQFDEARKDRERQAFEHQAAVETTAAPATLGFVSYSASAPHQTDPLSGLEARNPPEIGYPQTAIHAS